MTERTERASANDAVADLGTEIMLLVEMIVEHAAPWLDGLVAAGHTGGWFGAADADGSGGSGGSDGSGESGTTTSEHGQYDCGWCPLCAVVSMARGNQPEFSARAIEQLAQLVGVLRAVLADRWYPGEGIHMPGAPRAERTGTGPAWTSPEPAGRTSTRSAAPAPSRPSGGSRAQHITVRKATSETGETS